MINQEKQLIEKSIEAFLLALEIYNKPTIKYRVEGFSFFICNAWELMLKSHLLKRGENIYYKDNPSRSLALNDVLSRVYTDKNTGKRKNLEQIIQLRNTSTHFINEDYEAKYVPLFQACVLNYVNEISKFHSIDITDYLADNFLVLSFNYKPLSNEEIKLKYSPEVAQKLIEQANSIEVLSNEIKSDGFVMRLEQKLYITKHQKEADFSVSIDKNSSSKIVIAKELKDPYNTHKYSYDNVIEAVGTRLKNKKIVLDYQKGFNKFVLNLVINFYNVKDNKKFAYKHVIGRQEHYTYSEQFVEFIMDEIVKRPGSFVKNLKQNR